MIRFRCDNCGETYEVQPQHAGKTTKCAKCKSPVTVPRTSTKPPAAPAVTQRQPAFDSPRPQATESPRVHVSVDQTKASGTQGFFRAFGITSGFMAAVAAVIIGIPILACGGCLVSMIGIGATVDAPPRSTSSTFANSPTESPENSPDPLAQVTGELTQEPDLGPIETIVIQTLPEVDLSGKPGVFVFDGMTATIKDQYVNDVRIVDVNGRPVTVDVLLENSSTKNWTPSLRLEFVNKYGVVLGYDSISWAFTALEPNKRYTESISFYANRFDEIFRHSPIKRPADFDKPTYLILTYR